MRPPPKIEKGAAANDAPDLNPSKASVSSTVYRCDSRTASDGRHLRLIHPDGLKEKVLERAAEQIQEHPSTLPLWSFRLAQHLNRGTFTFGEVCEALELAAGDAGVRQLYQGIADAMTHDAGPMPLTVLKGGVQ